MDARDLRAIANAVIAKQAADNIAKSIDKAIKVIEEDLQAAARQGKTSFVCSTSFPDRDAAAKFLKSRGFKVDASSSVFVLHIKW